jgi:hypothetical protein
MLDHKLNLLVIASTKGQFLVKDNAAADWLRRWVTHAHPRRRCARRSTFTVRLPPGASNIWGRQTTA